MINAIRTQLAWALREGGQAVGLAGAGADDQQIPGTAVRAGDLADQRYRLAQVEQPVGEPGDGDAGTSGAGEEDVASPVDLIGQLRQLRVVDQAGVVGQFVQDGGQVAGGTLRWTPSMIRRMRAAPAAASRAPVPPLPTIRIRGPRAR